MNKKTIIIIILVAVAVFIAWRKGWFAKTAPAVELLPSSSTATGDDVDDIIEATSMTVQEKEKCRNLVKWLQSAIKSGSSAYTVDGILKAAATNGLTYNQQLVNIAVYQLYKNANLFGEDYYKQIYREITSM